MDRTAKMEGKTRSAWVKEAILEKMQAKLPQAWYQTWGTWEDNRSSEEILADIDQGYAEKERETLK